MRGEEGEGTGPNHRPTGMLRDRRVFIFKTPDIIIVIIVRELMITLLHRFDQKITAIVFFPFFFPL